MGWMPHYSHTPLHHPPDRRLCPPLQFNQNNGNNPPLSSQSKLAAVSVVNVGGELAVPMDCYGMSSSGSATSPINCALQKYNNKVSQAATGVMWEYPV